MALKAHSKKALVLLDQAVFSGGSFLLTMLLARVLGAIDFGYFSSVVLFNYGVVSAFSALVVQPFQVSHTRFAGNSYMSFIFWLQMALVTTVVLISAGISSLDHQLFDAFADLPIGHVFFFIGFVMHDHFRKVFLAKQEIQNVLILDMLTVSLQMSVSFFLWLGPQKTLAETTFLLGLAYLPGFVIAVLRIKPFITGIRQWTEYAKVHVQQGKWLLITTVLQWWSGNIFVVASGVLLGVKTLGAFRLVQSLFGVLSLLFQTFENYALPEASRILSLSHADARTYLRNISAQVAIGFGVILVALFVFSTEAITLIGGSEYAQYAFIVKGMTVLYALIFLGYPVRIAVRILVMNRVFFIGYLLSFVFSLLSYNALLQHWGVSGAIVGLTLSQLILILYWQYSLIQKQFILWK